MSVGLSPLQFVTIFETTTSNKILDKNVKLKIKLTHMQVHTTGKRALSTYIKLLVQCQLIFAIIFSHIFIYRELPLSTHKFRWRSDNPTYNYLRNLVGTNVCLPLNIYRTTLKSVPTYLYLNFCFWSGCYMDHEHEMCRTPVNQVVLMVGTEKKQGNQSIVSDINN